MEDKMLNVAAIAPLKSSLRGELIEPNDARYDEARKVYNGMIDRRPRIIARCVDVADVIAAVTFGRENKLLIAIRGGGHNAGGLGDGRRRSHARWRAWPLDAPVRPDSRLSPCSRHIAGRRKFRCLEFKGTA